MDDVNFLGINHTGGHFVLIHDYDGDWTILVHDGKKVLEGHSLYLDNVFEYLVGKIVLTFEDVSCEDYYENPIFEGVDHEEFADKLADYFCEKTGGG